MLLMLIFHKASASARRVGRSRPPAARGSTRAPYVVLGVAAVAFFLLGPLTSDPHAAVVSQRLTHHTATAAPDLPGIYVYDDAGSTGTFDGHVKALSLDGTRLVTIGRMLSGASNGSVFGIFSPDGSLEAYTHDAPASLTPIGITIRTLPGDVQRTIPVPGVPLAFTPDDTTLAYLAAKPGYCNETTTMTVALLDLADGGVTTTPLQLSSGGESYTNFDNCDSPVIQAAFSADGSSLYYTDPDGELYGAPGNPTLDVWRGDLSDGSITPLVGRSGWSWPERVTLSRDGSVLAFLRFRPSLIHGVLGSPLAEQLVIARPDGSMVRTVALGRVQNANAPGEIGGTSGGGLVFSPDGRSAIVACPTNAANDPMQTVWTLCRIDVPTGTVRHLGDPDLIPLAWPAGLIVPAGPRNRP